MSEPAPVGTRVRVSVPATSANLGPGFDALALAVSLHDELDAEVVGDAAPALTVTVAGEGESEVPRDESHLVVRALLAACADAGVAPPRLRLHCTNRIPHGRGLGSSAAAVVAGLLLARALVAPDLTDDDLLRLATDIEGHPDNAAACLLGGLTVAWDTDTGVRAARTEPAADLPVRLLVPAARLATATARGLLPATVPHGDAAHAAGRAALLVVAMTGRPDLLLAATEDRLHQPYRAQAMPETARLVGDLHSRGVAAVVSGAGPSVLVLSPVDVSQLPPSARGWQVLDVAVSGSGPAVSVLPADPSRI